ncbi:dipeptide ABC transporter ATP-binding protein [Sneathia sanguinegens]|uniref:dipeptide ABC transporter ATP-binding protein n=1 Tax=Sneathia sanguinegens TaxID=40543 RepID=UPI0023F7A7CE|nr:ABC transporter ATP-binding protein [Sneathia sanguinegens]
MRENILEVKELNTYLKKDKKELRILKDISFNLKKGKILGIVGESGCGKSLTVNSIINLLENCKIEGEIKYYNKDEEITLNKLKQYGKIFRNIRGNKISMIFQDPMAALNPVYTIANQITEVLLEHKDIKKSEALKEAIELLEKLGIKNAKDRINDYPHQFSGGQLQRIIIAMAMICKPDILIADEPTTALDVTIQAQILKLLKDLKEEYNMSIILITHDLGVIAEMADEVLVMYAGEVVEGATAYEIFKNPLHPYTRSLLQAIPTKGNKSKKLYVIDGIVPPITQFTENICRFSNRIPFLPKEAHEINPSLHEVEKDHFVRCTCYKSFKLNNRNEEILEKNKFDEVVLEVKNLKKYYNPKRSIFRKKEPIKALEDINFNVKKGQTIGIIGESGCGKSTLAKSIMKLHDITSGEINIDLGKGLQNIYKLSKGKDLLFRKKVQMVFQDPYSSLNPSKKIYEALDEPMRVHKMGDKKKRYEKILEALKMVNLPKEYLDRYPHEFSGGQRQRICIARALCLEPELLILDEPVSALDLSVQAQVLNYLIEIQQKKSISYIFISHDLGVVKYMCDYIYIINNGKFVEKGTTEEIFNSPKNAYTKKLLESIPDISKIYGKDKNESNTLV